MNNEISMGKRIKELLAKKTLPTILAGSMLFGSGALVSEAEAYSLDEPSQSYEDFINYDGIKVFINGRYVEFSESTGYPFVLDGSTMIPLRAVSKAFGAKVDWNEYSKTASVSKYDTSVDVTVDSKEMKVKDLNDNSFNMVGVTKEAMVKYGRTYIPLRSLFECFGLNVRWDSEKQIAHIETVSLESLENIDFKGKKVYSINELIDMKDIRSFVFDGEEINREYLGVLSESNQYVVIVKDDKAQVFSYQFLSNLNYYYGKEKLIKQFSLNTYSDEVFIRNEIGENIEFIKNVVRFNMFMSNISTVKTSNNISISTGAYIKSQFEEIMINAEKIAAEIKNTTSDKRQQAELLTVILNKKIKYGHKSVAAVYTALVKNEAVCEGYARSYNLVADLLDIPCICVDGVNKSSNESHAWNEVYIDGEWYVCDATLGVTLGSLNLSNYSTNLIRDDEYLEDKDMIKLTYNFEN